MQAMRMALYLLLALWQDTIDERGMLMHTRRTLGLLLAAIMTVILVACGSSPASTQAAQTASVSQDDGTSCFTQMTPDQKNQLVSYINETGGKLDPASYNPDGTQDVCVLEPDGNGYNQHVYRSANDGISANDLALYMMMGGRSSTLATAMLISGGDGMDAGDMMTLALLSSVYPDGRYQRTYGYDPDARSWDRYKPHTVVTNYNVTNITYGNQPKVKFTDARTRPVPKGYETHTVPVASKPSATAPKPRAGSKPAPKPTGTALVTNKSAVATAGIPNNSAGGSQVSTGGAKPPAIQQATPAPKPAPKPVPKPAPKPAPKPKPR